MKRFKNYGLWVSIASLVLLILQTANVGIDVGKFHTAVDLILGVLVALGVISDPTTANKGYGNDK